MSETIEVSREDKSRARKAVVAAGLGNALEWYDIILFGFMATSITAVFYPGDGLSAQLMTWATFAITFVVRPLGAILIGRYYGLAGPRLVFAGLDGCLSHRVPFLVGARVPRLAEPVVVRGLTGCRHRCSSSGAGVACCRTVRCF